MTAGSGAANKNRYVTAYADNGDIDWDVTPAGIYVWKDQGSRWG